MKNINRIIKENNKIKSPCISRKLKNEDMHGINALLKEQRLPAIKSIEDKNWAIYGAFVNGIMVGMAGMFGYRRFPCADHPYGYIVELGGVYVTPDYRNMGIATSLQRYAVANIKDDFPLADAIVGDFTEANTEIAKQIGFKESTEHRLWIKFG